MKHQELLTQMLLRAESFGQSNPEYLPDLMAFIKETEPENKQKLFQNLLDKAIYGMPLAHELTKLGDEQQREAVCWYLVREIYAEFFVRLNNLPEKKGKLAAVVSNELALDTLQTIQTLRYFQICLLEIRQEFSGETDHELSDLIFYLGEICRLITPQVQTEELQRVDEAAPASMVSVGS